MAVTNIDLTAPSGAKRYENTALNGTISAVSSAAGRLYAVRVDNSLNGAASYLKMWNVASGSVTVGTTAPDWIFKIPASSKKTFIFVGDIDDEFDTALSAACVTAGGTAGTTNPTSSVNVQVVYDT